MIANMTPAIKDCVVSRRMAPEVSDWRLSISLCMFAGVKPVILN